jgi:hypothetical protein
MKTKTPKWQMPLLNVIIPAVTIPAILGVKHWQEDPAHSLGFLLARFFFVWLVGATAGGAAGFLALRFLVKR